MSTKTTARRMARNAGEGRQNVAYLPHTPMDLTAWKVSDVNGIENVIYTLGAVPTDYPHAKRIEVTR